MAKTFVKLHLFSLTEFDRVIALDVDIIVRRNIDHLFSAAVRAPAAVLDSHWADRGVMQGRAGGHTTARRGAVALFGEEEEEDRRREEEEVPHSPHTRHSPAAHLDLRA